MENHATVLSDSFGKDVTIIVDCFEVFIERPSNLLAQAVTWSSYKHHNTIKILLGNTTRYRVICVRSLGRPC